MKRQVFFSFHYEADAWRAGQVRNMGVVEEDSTFSDNDWEKVRNSDDKDIRDWIDQQMAMRSCVVVLVGARTASRKWVRHEIKEAWRKGKGVLAIDVHNLKDRNGNQATQGCDPMQLFLVHKEINWIRCDQGAPADYEVRLDEICPMKSFEQSASERVYAEIKQNIACWIEEAIAIRKQFPMP